MKDSQLIDDIINVLSKHGFMVSREDVNVSVSCPEKIEDDGYRAVFNRTLTIELSQYNSKRIIKQEGWEEYV